MSVSADWRVAGAMAASTWPRQNARARCSASGFVRVVDAVGDPLPERVAFHGVQVGSHHFGKAGTLSAAQGAAWPASSRAKARDSTVVEHAAAAGVTTIVEPGGSTRASEVVDSAAAHGIAHVQTGLRLFHH